MEIDFGRIQDDIAHLEVMISRAKGEVREASFPAEWDKVVGLAVRILDRVDMDEKPVTNEPEKPAAPVKPAKPSKK